MCYRQQDSPADWLTTHILISISICEMESSHPSLVSLTGILTVAVNSGSNLLCNVSQLADNYIVRLYTAIHKVRLSDLIWITSPFFETSNNL